MASFRRTGYRRNTTNICAKWITGQLQSWQQATGRHRQQTTGLQLLTKPGNDLFMLLNKTYANAL